MQLEEGMHLARAHFLVALPADALQLIAKALTLGVGARVSPVLRVNASKNPRRQHRGGVTGAFFVGEVGHDDRVFGLDPQIVHRAEDLQPAEHAEDAIVFPARRLGVEVAAHIDRKRIGVGALPLGEHIAHLVEPHGAARIFAPLLEQGAAFGVFVRQRLAVVAPRHAGADLGHFHQGIPQTVGINLEVLSGRGHRSLLCHRLGPCCFFTIW